MFLNLQQRPFICKKDKQLLKAVGYLIIGRMLCPCIFLYQPKQQVSIIEIVLTAVHNILLIKWIEHTNSFHNKNPQKAKKRCAFLCILRVVKWAFCFVTAGVF